MASAKSWLQTQSFLRSPFPVVAGADLSDMKGDEPYDYKFVKWMTKNKVTFTDSCGAAL